MTKLDFHRSQVRHFSNNFEQSYSYCEDGATPKSRSKCLWTFKNHHQAKYRRVNANTLYVAAILFSCSTLHRETLPCLPNTQKISLSFSNVWLSISHLKTGVRSKIAGAKWPLFSNPLTNTLINCEIKLPDLNQSRFLMAVQSYCVYSIV